MRKRKEISALSKTVSLIIVGVVLIAGVVVAVSLPQIGNIFQGPRQLQEVTFLLDWVVYGKHAMFYPSIELGLYEKYGLKVNMIRGSGSGDTIQKIDLKQAEFGFADFATLIIMRSKGAKVVMVGMIHHVAPHCIYYVKGRGITTPKDLEGKIVTSPAGDAAWVLFPAFAKATGIDINKIKHFPVEPALREPTVFEGKADFAATLCVAKGGFEVEARKRGLELGYFWYKDYGLDFYSNGIVVHEDTLREKPELVERFVKALYEGVDWALKNPEKALDILMKYHPELDREKAAADFQTAIGPIFGDVPKKAKTPLQLAWMDPQKVRFSVDIISQYYKLDRPVSPDELYTNRFAEKPAS